MPGAAAIKENHSRTQYEPDYAEAMELRTSEEGKQRRITFFYYAKIFSLYKKL
jgi:hypothetical protein